MRSLGHAQASAFGLNALVAEHKSEALTEEHLVEELPGYFGAGGGQGLPSVQHYRRALDAANSPTPADRESGSCTPGRWPTDRKI